MARGLTTKAIENLKPPSKRSEIPDPALSGLYLVAQPTGAKSWAFRYRSDGRPRKLTLGKWPVMGIADARLAASEALDAVEHGRDPGSEKLAQKKEQSTRADQDSIEALVETFAKRHLLKLKTGATVKRELERHAVTAWRGRDVGSISKRDVLDLLDAIVDSGRETSANRLRAYLGKFFNWCIERSILEASPMMGVKAPAKEKSRDRVLTDDEIRWFWQGCEAARPPWGPMGQLLLLSGQRLGEVSAMTDGEIEGDVWHLSTDRTKNGRSHDVPLSQAALHVLAGIERIKSKAGHIHTTTGDSPVSGFDSARNNIAEHMQSAANKERGALVHIPHWTFHDLRRTAATSMARLGISVVVIEAILNHVSGARAGVAGIYNRHSYAEEKRAAVDAWARFILSTVEGGTDNVVQMETVQ